MVTNKLVLSVLIVSCLSLDFLDIDLGRFLSLMSGNTTVEELVLKQCTGFLKVSSTIMRSLMYDAAILMSSTDFQGGDTKRKTVMIESGKPTTGNSSDGFAMVEGCCELLESSSSVSILHSTMSMID